MFQNFEIIELPLSLKSNRQMIKCFLSENELGICHLDYYAGIFDENKLLAGGGLEDNVMKCIAVDSGSREYNLANKLVSHLRSVVSERGYGNMFVYTKPRNENIFTSLAFHLVGRSTDAILLESDPHGISGYCKRLSEERTTGKNGCIVMNCNPMTSGHRYLIQKASQMVDTLHVIVISENKSEFSSSDRLQMVKDGVADFKNVKVHEGDKYVISSASFPCYFIKCVDSLTRTQIEMDLDIFCKHIAPALNISIRFVGTEPYDELTGKYNEAIKEKLAAYGIGVVEIERLKTGDKPVSASYVRQLIRNWNLQEACTIVPTTSKPFLLKKSAEDIAALAIEALREELSTTPKPGLVDKKDNGAHCDMDFQLMSKSIDTLYPYFIQLAEIGLKYYNSPQEVISKQVRNIGIEAEKEMLKVTGGVNTHRGTIFSMGLCITAIAIIISAQKELSVTEISKTIAFIVKDFQRQQDSNGGTVCRKYNIKGALDYAKKGYSEIFSKILPLYQKSIQTETAHNTVNIKTLLYLMTLIDDTNIYHRKGAEVAADIKKAAQDILRNYDEQKVSELNKTFIRNNISPGGCADMLAMVLFINKILKQKSIISN
jgi:[citrate (pro-3S)-lyase] ligase